MLYPPTATGRPWAGDASAAQLWSGPPSDATLYVHIPFCQTRCVFCPFHAAVADAVAHDAYIDALLAEAALVAGAVRHLTFTSVYFGGGTPSVLRPDQLARLIDGLRRHLNCASADVTMEAHPGTVDAGTLAAFRRAGVTRLSLGIQSFDAGVLARSDRGDTAGRVGPALDAALDAGFGDVNIDLMYGLPGQTEAVWRADLDRAVSAGVPGLTLYATVYLPAFAESCSAAGHPPPAVAFTRQLYEIAYDTLTASGYPQPHFGAGAFLHGGLNPHRRNVAHGRPTLGLGTWAFSSAGSRVWHNLFPAQEWSAAVRAGRLPIRQMVDVPEAERARKWVIEALLLAYLDLDQFASSVGREFSDVFRDELAMLADLGLAEVVGRELRLTRKGGHELRAIRYLFASEEVVATIEGGAAGL